MKSMLPSMAIFFMTYFYRARGTLFPLEQLLPLVGGNNVSMVDKNTSSAIKIVKQECIPVGCVPPTH